MNGSTRISTQIVFQVQTQPPSVKQAAAQSDLKYFISSDSPGLQCSEFLLLLLLGEGQHQELALQIKAIVFPNNHWNEQCQAILEVRVRWAFYVCWKNKTCLNTSHCQVTSHHEYFFNNRQKTKYESGCLSLKENYVVTVTSRC